MALLSSFSARKQIVPKPDRALREDIAIGNSWWKSDGSHEPAPAGTWHIRNAIVDKQNRRGPWSAPVCLPNLPLGWLLLGSNFNLPYCKHRAAVVWQAEQMGTGLKFWLTEAQRGGYGAFDTWLSAGETHTPFPWSSNNHLPYVLMIHDRYNHIIPIAESPLDIPSPPPPQVWLCNHHMSPCLVAWSWATHAGETDLSPSTQLSSVNPAVVGYRRLVINEPIPPGALGKYLYEQKGGQWKRQPAYPWSDLSTSNGYLIGVHDNQPILWSSHDGPVHSYQSQSTEFSQAPAGSSWSVISKLQAALYSNDSILIDDYQKDENGNIIGDPVVELYSPLIDVFSAPAFGRIIAAPGLGGWTLKQVQNVPTLEGMDPPANNHPTYWPAVVVMNQDTAIHGMRVEIQKPEDRRGPGLSHGITSSDFSGGQAFRFRMFDCELRVFYGGWPFITRGLHVGWESAGSNVGSHTASEWYIRDCIFEGNIRIQLEGTQTTNLVFENSRIEGWVNGEGPAIIIDGASVEFDTMVCAKVGTLFSLGFNATVIARNVFVDQPGVSLLDFNGHAAGVVEVSYTDTAGLDFVCRNPISLDFRTVRLEKWKKYRPTLGTQDSVAYSAAPQRLTLDVEGSYGLSMCTQLSETPLQEFSDRTAMYPSIPVERPENSPPIVIEG